MRNQDQQVKLLAKKKDCAAAHNMLSNANAHFGNDIQEKNVSVLSDDEVREHARNESI